MTPNVGVSRMRCALLRFQQLSFFLNHFSRALAVEATERTVGGDDSVAGDIGGKGIATQCLSDGLGTAATDATGKFAIGDSFAFGHTEEFQIDTTLELGDAGGCENLLADVGEVGHCLTLNQVILGNVSPKGGNHECLFQLVFAKQVDELLLGEEVDGDFLGFVEVLTRDTLHSLGNEGVGDVVLRAGIGGERGVFRPSASCVARLFEQFTLGGFEGRSVGGIHHACTKLILNDAKSVAVLTNKDELPIGGDGNDVNPCGIFKHIVFGHDGSVGHAQHVATGGEPRTANEVFGADRFPRLDVFLLLHII